MKMPDSYLVVAYALESLLEHFDKWDAVELFDASGETDIIDYAVFARHIQRVRDEHGANWADEYWTREQANE